MSPYPATTTPDTDACRAPSALAPLLARMREPYQPVIEVGPGWHALLLALDARLAQIAPDYLIGQVTDRFGYLRF